MAKHGAVEHWAKIEVPSRTTDLMLVRERLAARYPLERFAAVRCRLRAHFTFQGLLGQGQGQG